MKKVDARGEVCPKPLIMVKKALTDANIGDKFVMLIDNETSKNNVESFLNDNKVAFATTQQEDVFSLEVSKSENKTFSEKVGGCCSGPSTTKTEA